MEQEEGSGEVGSVARQGTRVSPRSGLACGPGSQWTPPTCPACRPGRLDPLGPLQFAPVHFEQRRGRWEGREAVSCPLSLSGRAGLLRPGCCRRDRGPAWLLPPMDAAAGWPWMRGSWSCSDPRPRCPLPAWGSREFRPSLIALGAHSALPDPTSRPQAHRTWSGAHCDLWGRGKELVMSVPCRPLQLWSVSTCR